VKPWLALVKEAVTAWINDSAPSKGAALAYYATFSIAPLLFIAISVAGLVFGPDAVQGAVFAQLADLMGENGAKAVQEMLANLQRPTHGLIGAGVGIALLLVGASTVFGQLQSALDSIWQVPIPPKASGVWDFLRARLLPIGMVFGMAFLVIVSLLFSTAISALGKWWGPLFSEGLAHALDVWVGAAVTAALFTIGKWAIGLYLGKSTVASSFGAFASLVIVMVWVYYSAQIFLLGAEFTWVYARHYGSRRDVAPDVEEIPVTPAANEPLIAPLPKAKKLQRPNPAALAAALIGGIALRLIVARTPWRRMRRYMFE
jgi:membrane protein